SVHVFKRHNDRSVDLWSRPAVTIVFSTTNRPQRDAVFICQADDLLDLFGAGGLDDSSSKVGGPSGDLVRVAVSLECLVVGGDLLCAQRFNEGVQGLF